MKKYILGLVVMASLVGAPMISRGATADEIRATIAQL
jgi:hypothetical protein